MMDDASLLARYARNRSEAAFGELVQRHLTLVYSAALRRTDGDVHRARDVAQIVFTALARDAAALSQHAALTGWLYTATRNAAIDLLRAERGRQQREEKAHIMQEILTSSYETSPDWERLRPVLDDAMDELGDRDREAVLLRFFENQPFATIATALRVNEDAARKRVDRALGKLGELLSRRGITSTGGALGVLLANQVAVAAPAGVAAAITTAALAGAGAGAAGIGAAGIFIMSTSKLVTGMVVAVAGVAIGSAVYQANAARESAARVASTGAERDDLRARLGAMEKRARENGDSLVAAQKELDDLRASVAAPAAAPMVRPPASQSGPAMDYVLEHPETHAAFAEQQELRVKARYEQFLKGAGLTAPEQDRFFQAMGKMMGEELDFMSSLHTHGFGVGNLPRDPQGRAQFQQLLGDHQQALRATSETMRELLGKDRFAGLKRYESTIPERNVADQMAARLYQTDAPLTPPLAEQLTEVLAQNRFTPQAAPSPGNTLNGTFITPKMLSGRIGQAMQQGGMNLLDWPAPITDAALAKAGAILTPGQLAVLRQIQAHQLTQFQLAPPPPSPAKTPATGK